MNNIDITFPDKAVRSYPEGITSQEVADSIGSRLGRAVVVAKVNGNLKDLNYKISENSTLELFTGESPEGHDTLLHSTAHLMAQAIKYGVKAGRQAFLAGRIEKQNIAIASSPEKNISI